MSPSRLEASSIDFLWRSTFEYGVAISGVGRSARGTCVPGHRIQQAEDAASAALGDAGLLGEAIDGICVDPAGEHLFAWNPDDYRVFASSLGVRAAVQYGQRTSGPAGGVIDAMLLVGSGLCRHVLCLTVPGASRLTADGLRLVSGAVRPRRPWTSSAMNRTASRAARYLDRYGLGREPLGWVAIAARRHAAGNPDAVCRAPLDIDSYLAATPLSNPLGPFDLGPRCDQAIAVVVSARTEALLTRRPIWVNAVSAPHQRSTWRRAESHPADINGSRVGAELWQRASLSVADVDFVGLDDTYSFNILAWLEELGFCDRGGAADFVRGGTRIGPDGVLPVNPDGGQLNSGPCNSYSNIREAVVQLRGEADTRQIPSARVAVVSSGTPERGTAMVLTRECSIHPGH